MARQSTRKLFLFGRYSLALLLPKKWLTELAVEDGDLVTLDLDRKKERIIIHFNLDSVTVPSPSLKSAKTANAKGKKSTSPSATPTDSDDDWQPIPQL